MRAVTGPAPGLSVTHVVVFGGNGLGTDATGHHLIMNQTALADASGNALGDNVEHRQVLRDGQAPKIVGGAITGGRTLTITYSELVAKVPGAYGTLTLVSDGDRAVADPTGVPAAAHAVTFAAPEAATNATGSILLNQTVLADTSGNALGASTAFQQYLADAQRPTIKRSAITGGQNLTITYSEPVAAPPGAYSALDLGDSVTRTVTGFTGNETDTHVVEFSGTAAPLRARGTLQIAENAVRDLAPVPNTLGDGATLSRNIHDDRAPSVITAKVTGPGTATVVYSRAVTALQTHYTSLEVAGVQRAVTGLAGGGSPGADTHTISFTPADAPPNATGSVGITAASVLDDRSRPLGTASFSQGLTDGQAPAVSGATAVSLDRIRVEFNEPVRAQGTAGHGGWSVSGDDAPGLDVASRSGVSSLSAAMTLALDGNLSDTLPDGVELAYTAGGPGSVDLEDAAGNALPSVDPRPVADGIPPAVASANVTGPGNLTVVYSEAVDARPSAYSALSLSPGSPASALTLAAGNSTRTHVVEFDGAEAATGSNGTLTVDETALTDGSGNALGGRTAFEQGLADGQAPVLVSARVTGPLALAITYSEPVAGDRTAYSGAALDGYGQRSVESLSGSGSAVHTIALSGAPAAGTNTTGSIVLDAAALADASGNPLGTERDLRQRLDDGQRPELVSAIITGTHTVAVRYTEPVTAPLSAYAGLDLGPDGTRSFDRLEGNGSAAHSVSFAGSPAAPHARGSITIDERLVLDTASPPNSLGTDAARAQQLADARNPSIVSAVVAAPDVATIRYDRPVTAPQAAYVWLEVAGLERAVSGLGGDGTREHRISFAPGGAPSNATGLVTIDGAAVSNPDGGPLGTGPFNRTLADGQAPTVVSARVTGPNAATVEYSEPVARVPAAYASVSLSPGGGRTAAGPSGDPAPVHVVSFGGGAAATGATGTLVVDQTALLDAAGNALGASASHRQPLADGQAPAIVSALVSAGNSLSIEYSEPVARARQAYSGLVLEPGGARDAGGPPGAAPASAVHEVPFGGAAAAANATGSIAVDQTALADAAGNALGASSSRRQQLADGQDPSFVAAAVSLGSIRVEFDEPVRAQGTSGAGGWSLSGGDAAGLEVSSRSDISAGSTTLMLALGGSLPDTAPDGAVLSYARGGGAAAVADLAGNEPRPRAGNGTVLDGIAPAVASASVSGGNVATVAYTEPVAASADPPAYTGLLIDGSARTITEFTAGLAERHDIGFGGPAAPPGATGSVSIGLALVRDAAGNAAGEEEVRQGLAAGQAPPGRVAAGASAAFVTPNTVEIAYSHALGKAPGAAAGPAYGNVTIAPADGSPPSSREAVSEAGIGTATHTVRFGGGPIGAADGGSIELLAELESAAAGEGQAVRWHAAGRIPVEPGGDMRATVVPPAGQPRTVVEIVRDSFERRINGTAGGETASLAINMSGLARPPVAGGDGDGGGGSAVFPSDANVTVIASFAEVSFPPNVTATALPADRLLNLYVAPRSAWPSAADLAAAFGHGDPATLVVGRVVEVGGNGSARVVFDMPVRILLAGQAGGLAFYADGAGGDVVPIETACRADDTAAVHGQLGGSGECQIDPPGEGADTAVYTYHLTLFGAVHIQDGPQPPPRPDQPPLPDEPPPPRPDQPPLPDEPPPPRPDQPPPPPVVVVPPPSQQQPPQPGAQPPPGAGQFFNGGGGGGGGRSGGGGGGGGGGGSPLPADSAVVTVYSAAWDCGDGTVRITTNGGSTDPAVTVLSSDGSEEAEMVAARNLKGMTVYEARLPDDTIFSIRAVSIDGRAVSTASEVVRTGGACAGEEVFVEYAAAGAAQPAAAPAPAGAAASDASAAPPGPAAEPGPTAAGAGGSAGAAAPEAEPEPEPALPPAAGGDGGAAPAFEMEEGRGAAHYVERYAGQPEYREWFSQTYPQYADICEAVGAAPGCVEAHLGGAGAGGDGGAPAVVCREGMALGADGRCAPAGGGAGMQPADLDDARPGDGAGGGAGGCLIATATYGTELAPAVQALREYRDGTLLATGHGSAFMSAFSAVYYAFSPHVADLEREHPAVRHAVAALAAPMLHALPVAALADPESNLEVAAYGAAALAAIAGMYVAAPAAAAVSVARIARRWRG